MKLSSLIWVLGLASATAACNSGPVVQGCLPGYRVDNNSGLCTRIPSGGGGSGGSGGTGGGGTGGAPAGECTNEADDAVYADLTYKDKNGVSSSGSAAASAIASDCVFGSGVSVPPLPGCSNEALAVLACGAACPPATLNALTVCVEGCQQDAIDTITGSMLTEGCEACYGASVSCSAANCATFCANPNAPACVECRCVEDCTPGFDRCSGLPASGACDPYL